VTTHLLDRRLQDFGAIRASGMAVPGGDIALDDDPCIDAGARSVRFAPGD
jgi:hypothetical protein